MEDRIPTSVLSILKATQQKGEKLTTLECRMTGSFKPFTKAVIFPGEKEFQVRDIDKSSGDNYKVKIKGLPFKSCVPFAVITPVNLRVKYGKRAYFVPSSFHSKEFFNGDYCITGGIFKGYRLFNKEKHSAKVRKAGNLYSVDLPFKAPLVPGAEYFFENSAGFKGEMKLIYPGYLDKKHESIISSRIDKFRSRPGVKGIYSIILRTDNYVNLPYYLEEEEFEGSIKIESVRIMEREYNSVRSKIIKQSKASGGVDFSKLKMSFKVTTSLFHCVVDKLAEEGEIFLSDGYLLYNGENRESLLSPLAKETYKLIVNASIDGVSTRDIKNPGMVNCFYEIRRMKLAYSLDDDLYFTEDSFFGIIKNAFAGKSTGDCLTIQDIRGNTGLSRRYIISLLNYLEENEYIVREVGDERIIKKLP